MIYLILSKIIQTIQFIESMYFNKNVIGIVGFEPTTACSQSRCSTKLSYIPFFFDLTLLKEIIIYFSKIRKSIKSKFIGGINFATVFKIKIEDFSLYNLFIYAKNSNKIRLRGDSTLLGLDKR